MTDTAATALLNGNGWSSAAATLAAALGCGL
jgi:hypothetical protein